MEAEWDGADPKEIYSVEMRVGSTPRNLTDELAPLRSDAASLSRHCPHLSPVSPLLPHAPTLSRLSRGPLAQRRPRSAAARAPAVATVHGPRHAVPRSPAVDWPRHAALAPAGEAEPLRRRGRRAMSAAAAPPGEEGAAAGEGRGRAPSTTRAKAGSGGSGPAPAPLLHAEAHGRAGGGRRRWIRLPSPRRPRKGAAPAAPGHAAGGRRREKERGSGGGE